MRDLLLKLYRTATAAVAPGPALGTRLKAAEPAGPGRIWIIATGKAALPMAEEAIAHLRGRGLEPAGGVIVSPEPGETPHAALSVVPGEHPEPGPGSLAAAGAVERVCRAVAPEDEVWVLLSGGTTSLLGAPLAGITPAELRAIYRLLLGSGLDITAMNRIRKRFSRWGGGRLAQALAPARVRVYAVSDVIGDDLASIGSGPCVPDPTTAAEVHRLLESGGLWDRLPQSARALLSAIEEGKAPETPKPGDRAFARVTVELIASNRLAVAAASGRAAELGLTPVVIEAPLAGEAATAGASVAAKLLEDRARAGNPQPDQRSPDRCLLWGGETTVTLGESATGLGGRCQELALAAARELAGIPGVWLLAAGTDGRDGPTDAAGAVVDGETWTNIVAARRDPARDLAVHDAYPALDAVGALIRTGLTGTNVMDVVIGIVLSAEC